MVASRPKFIVRRAERNRNDWRACASWILVCLVGWTYGSSLYGQGFSHSDVDFIYRDQRITTDRRVYTASMNTTGISRQFSSNPGFASETDVGGGIGASDQIVYHLLGPLLAWDGQHLIDVSSSTSVRIQNNPPSVPDAVVDGASGVQWGAFDPPQQRIGQASSAGDFHAHVNYFLEPLDPADPADLPHLGAYGVKMQLASNRAEINASDPFFVVLNYGLAAEPLALGVSVFASLLTKPRLPGDFDGNGQLDLTDIDGLSLAIREASHDARWDVNDDQFVDATDRRLWVESLARTFFGDSTLDGQFDSTDFVHVFQQGEYEDAIGQNSGWADGDWNGNGDFDTSDFVVAFQGGGFEQGPRIAIAVPEPGARLLWTSTAIAAVLGRPRPSRHRRTLNMWRWVTCLALLCLSPATIVAQDHEEGHSDIEFYYARNKIEIVTGAEGRVFEGQFPLTGIDRQFTSEPGFASEAAEGLGISAGDELVYHVRGPLQFWNGNAQPVPAGAQLRISNSPPAPLVPDTIVSATSGPLNGSFTPARNRIGAADDQGEFHNDLRFFLEPNLLDSTPSVLYGAYGLELTLSSSRPGIGASDPFFVVFNVGLAEDAFEEGVAHFAALVPEPATGSIALWLAVPLLRYRPTAAIAAARAKRTAWAAMARHRVMFAQRKGSR